MIWLIGFIVLCYLGFKLCGFLLENVGRIILLVVLVFGCYWGYSHYFDNEHTAKHHLVR